MSEPARDRAASRSLPAIHARQEIARRIIVGLAAANPTLAEIWQLGRMRLDRASLLAAMRATIKADADGEADPLAYLRDELADQEDRHDQ
jgi:hypothetical protein